MPALPAAPAPPAGAPDPRDATYWATAAELGHQYEHTLASFQEGLADAKAGFLSNQQKLDVAEPLALTNIRNRANEEGLLSSGAEQQRTGQQQGNYTRSRGLLATGFQQTQDKANRGMNEAGENYTDKMATNLSGAETRQREGAERQAERQPTLGAPAAAAAGPVPGANPGGQRTYTRNPPAPGNVPGYTETLPNGGFVRVGSATLQERRKAAAKRVTG